MLYTAHNTHAIPWHAATQLHNKLRCNLTECFNMNITLARPNCKVPDDCRRPNTYESSNFNENLIKVLINVHLLANELCEYQTARCNVRNCYFITRGTSKTFPGFAVIILQEFLLWIKKCTLAAFFALEMQAEEKPLESENQLLVSPSRQCSWTPVDFGEGFVSKEKCDNTGASPTLSWPGCSWMLHVQSTEISIEATALSWRYCYH